MQESLSDSQLLLYLGIATIILGLLLWGRYKLLIYLLKMRQ